MSQTVARPGATAVTACADRPVTRAKRTGWALTYQGRYRAEAAEDDLGNGRHPLSAVFYAGHGVLTNRRACGVLLRRLRHRTGREAVADLIQHTTQADGHDRGHSGN